MKTKELIRQLQEADPSGEEEVCVGNVDIHFVELLPAYYDGALQVLTRDENCKFYNIIGAKYKRSGNKVKIHTLSITDAISNNREMPVDYSELPTDRQESAKKSHDELREWHKRLENQLEWDYFHKWVAKQAYYVTADTDEIEGAVFRFFEKHVSADDPLPEGGVPFGHNYITTREMQWDQKYQVVIDEGFLKVKVRNEQTNQGNEG